VGRRTARLFVALWPPEHVVEELSALRRKDQRGVRFVPPENWHVTLRFLGDADPDEVSAAMEGLTAAPTEACLGPAVDVLGERALVVPVRGVDDLAATVVERTRRIGEPPRARFTGHLTLARLQRGAPMPAVLGALVTAAFEVDEVALVESRLDPDGARYRTVETWPVG
jgi:2'-5' RNA ligase